MYRAKFTWNEYFLLEGLAARAAVNAVNVKLLGSVYISTVVVQYTIHLPFISFDITRCLEKCHKFTVKRLIIVEIAFNFLLS